MVPKSDVNCTGLFLCRTYMVLAKYLWPLYVDMLFKTPISFDAKTTACPAWLRPRAQPCKPGSTYTISAPNL
jgi:hypothetical protein